MQELINSLVRLSAAATVYTIQQLQAAAGTVDPTDSMERLCRIIDSMTDALTAQLDAKKKPTLQSISSLGSDMVERTFETLEALNRAGLDPAELLESANKVLRRSSDSVVTLIRPEGREKKAGHQHSGAHSTAHAH